MWHKNLFDPATHVTIYYVYCVLIDVLNYLYRGDEVISRYNLPFDELINAAVGTSQFVFNLLSAVHTTHLLPGLSKAKSSNRK